MPAVVALVAGGALMSSQAGKTAKKGGDAARNQAEIGYSRAEAALSPYNQFGQQYGLGGMASLMGGGTSLPQMAQQQPSPGAGVDDEMRNKFQLDKALDKWVSEGQWDVSMGRPVVGVNVAESTLRDKYPEMFTSSSGQGQPQQVLEFDEWWRQNKNLLWLALPT